MVPSPDFVQVLRDAGLRVTRPRVAVLAAVHAHPHADTDSITAAVRDELPEVSHQAVYDCLNALTTNGLLRRIQPSRSVARYDPRTGDNHHHLVCRSCGVIVDVDCAVGEAPCLTAANSLGFTVDEAEVIYWGHCPACAAGTGSEPAAEAAAGSAVGSVVGPATESAAVDDADTPHVRQLFRNTL